MKRYLKIQFPVARLLAFAVVAGVMLLAHPALAQGGDLGGPFESIMQSLAELLRNLATTAFLLGLILWAIGKITRPYFPQISQMTSNYIMEAVIGIVVLFAASEIVDWIASAVTTGG